MHDLGAPRAGKAGYLLSVPGARRAIRRIAPDLVHAHWLTSYGLLAMASGVRPLVSTAHGDDLLIAPANPAFRQLIRRVLQASILVTVPSEQMRDVARSLAGESCRVEVMQYGVESDRLIALALATRSAGEGSGGTHGVVSARPLLALYRFDALLDAIALRPDRDDWRLDLFGDGPERPALAEQARRLGIDAQVVLHGQRPSHEIEAALAGARLYVSVAESDGASIALLEALALGPTPVLSDIPANRAWVEDGANGVLVPIDPCGIADGLGRALALDPDAVRAANAEIVATRGDRDRNLSILEQLLVDLVAAR